MLRALTLCWCAVELHAFGGRQLAGEWIGHGGNVFNTRHSPSRAFTTQNVKLEPSWTFDVGGDVSATPTIRNGVTYFPSWDGRVYALNARTGALLWMKNINTDYYNGTQEKAYSRSSPTFWKDTLLLFCQYPADVIAVNPKDGSLLWTKNLDPHPAAILTMTGLVDGDFLYEGVSSLEEVATVDPTYPCCSFSGRMVKLDLNTQTVVWTFFTIPEDMRGVGKFAGAAVWGSTPPLDHASKTIFISTGNFYSAPKTWSDCIVAAGKDEAKGEQCETRPLLLNAVIALDSETGAMKWYRRPLPPEAWNGACLVPDNANCPNEVGVDWDFGMAPMLDKATVNGVTKTAIFIGQKSAWVYCFDVTGEKIWATNLGGGGYLGGVNFGAAMDETRVYVGNENSVGGNGGNGKFKLKNGTLSADGGWAALDKNTGEVLWTTSVPAPSNVAIRNGNLPTVANGVIFTTSPEAELTTQIDPFLRTPIPQARTGGYVYALDAKDGTILSHFKVPEAGSVYGGFAVVDKCAYVGTGYRQSFGFAPGGKLVAFCLGDTSNRLITNPFPPDTLTPDNGRADVRNSSVVGANG